FYQSYDLYRSILQAKASFLIRLSSRSVLYRDDGVRLDRFKEGWFHYWPSREQEKKQPSVCGRVLRVGDGKADVWLLTNLAKEELSRRTAAKIYRWRWHNEGLFRTYKRTLDKTKLRHRTPPLVFREAEGS